MKNIKSYTESLNEAESQRVLNSSLLYNTRMDRPDLVSDLLQKGASPDATDGSGMTALGWAAYKGHTRILMQLIDAGADVNLPSEGSTALCSAISGEAGPGERLKMVEALLSANADPNTTDQFRRTPLHLATYNDTSIDVIKALLEAGADPNTVDNRNNVPLYWASIWGKKDVLNFLIKRGADPFPVFKTVEDLYNFFDGDLSWAPVSMQEKWKRMRRGKSAFGM